MSLVIHAHNSTKVKDTAELAEYMQRKLRRLNGRGSLTSRVLDIRFTYHDPNSEESPCSDCNRVEYGDGIRVEEDMTIDIDPQLKVFSEPEPVKRRYGKLQHLEHCEAFD